MASNTQSKSKKKKKAPKKVEITYPEWAKSPPPKTLTKSRHIDGVQHLAGVGNPDADIMIVAPCALEEEIARVVDSTPQYLKGPAGNLLQKTLRQCGVEPQDVYYTALCKYNLPKGQKFKPKAHDLHWNMEVLDWEMKTVKPKLVICLGKSVFDQFVNFKCALRDIQGGFFASSKWDTTVYAMDMATTPVYRPEYLPRFILDMQTAVGFAKSLSGDAPPKIPTDYQVIDTMAGLTKWVGERLVNGDRRLSVDCEWGGQDHIDGKLRSLQVCWAEGKAVYIKFRDENKNWAFDTDLASVSRVLQTLMNRPEVRFLGHNLSADYLWMHHHLGIEVYKKAAFDTMFAELIVDEYADAKLERLSLKYTDLGRYDTELFLVKKKLKITKDEGYERIPDKVIVPYACKDVDVVFRAAPIIDNLLRREGLEDYYYNINLPYVTDVFTTMSQTGLPVNMGLLDIMRETFANNEALLLIDLRMQLKKEASQYLAKTLFEVAGARGAEFYNKCLKADKTRKMVWKQIYDLPELDVDSVPWDDSLPLDEVLLEYANCRMKSEDDLPKKQKAMYNKVLKDLWEGLLSEFKELCGMERFTEHVYVLEHFWVSQDFKIGSDDHKRRWLFQVKKFTPVKTTKKDGIQMNWDKVLELPPDRQGEFAPATDKETMTILADKDPMVAHVLQLNSVATIVKSFLSQPDPKTGEEKGLHKWVCSDGRLHPNFACTETGRPRTWNPNVLNYPKAVTRPIEAAFKRLGQNKPYSLRSCVEAPEGWCFIDADLDTAEVISLAYIASDEEMIAVCTSPDLKFVRVHEEETIAAGVPSLKFKGIFCARLENLHGKEHLIHLDDSGNYVHPKRDMHWEMAEQLTGKPREELDDDLDRTAGKVGMFSIPYGATANLLERMIESFTGTKPEPGTGDRLIEAYNTKFEGASYFLRTQEYKVEDPGYYRSVSGRVRHFHTPGVDMSEGMSDRLRKSILAPLLREARNYPMQEIVAATMARVAILLLDRYIEAGMQARPMILLHDALTVQCPLEERHEAERILKECMGEAVTWDINGRTLSYGVDAAKVLRWGLKPTAEQSEMLAAA